MSALFHDLSHLTPQALAVAGPAAIATACLVGGAHCTVMCGPLVAAVSKGRKSIWGYHLGRLLSYLSLGLLAGGFGQLVTTRIQSPYLSGSLLVFFALTLVIIAAETFGYKFPRPFAGPLHSLWTQSQSWSSGTFKSVFGGFFSALLPCSQLHGFLLAAALTGSAWLGGALLLALWAASLPGLYLFNRLTIPLAARRWVTVVILIFGFISIAAFATRLSAQPNEPTELSCHH